MWVPTLSLPGWLPDSAYLQLFPDGSGRVTVPTVYSRFIIFAVLKASKKSLFVQPIHATIERNQELFGTC